MSNPTDERITQIENEISFYKGAFWLATAALLAFAALVNWWILPSAAQHALDKKFTDEMSQKIDDAIEKSKRLNNEITTVYEPIVSTGTVSDFLIEEKHLLCAINNFAFNYSANTKSGRTKICRVIQQKDGTWLLTSLGEEKQTWVCGATCIH